MNITELHITHLLECNGLAAVPGLGVLMLHRQPASLQPDGTLCAPRGIITFDPAAKLDDKALCESISRREACSAAEASDIIADDVEQLWQRLRIEGSARLGNLGRFVFSDNGVPAFEQDAAWQVPGLWFGDIKLLPLDEPARPKTIVLPEEEERRETFLRSLRRTASGAAAIAGFALVAFIASQLPQRSTTTRSASIYADESVACIAEPMPRNNDRAPLMLVFNTPTDGTAAVDVAAQTPAANGKYCLVVASLASRADAEKFIAGRKGLNILEKDGRFRVYTLSAETLEALQMLAQEEDAFSTYPSAWICRR